MPASASPDPRVSAPDSRPAIVAKLRSAGCVFAEDEAQLLISAAATPASLSAMVERRAAGEPLEHVLGWAEFCGLRIAVGPGVFIPRRRTELLIREAAAVARQPGPVVVVDLCCGSGAVGAALAAALGGAAGSGLALDGAAGSGLALGGAAGSGLALGGVAGSGLAERRVELHAADLDPAAVWCARRNVAAAGGRVYQGDLYEPLPAALRGRVDILVANAPYVPTGEVALLPAEARVHEPLLALDGGADGLDILRRVAAGAPRWLAPGGHLLVETSERQAPQITEAVARAGLAPRLARSEELNATAVIAVRPAPGNGPGGG
jgi:release factor glutamine methyltransferase